MASVSLSSSALSLDGTAADLLKRLGRVPPWRVRLVPAPGTATERDVIQAERRTDRLCELIDGTLVEKVMGTYESMVAVAMIYFLKDYLRRHRLGVVLAPDGMLRILPKQVRIPDVSFLSWQRLGGRRVPREPILALRRTWLSKCSPKATPRPRWRGSCGTISRGASAWYGSSTRGTRSAKSYSSPEQCQSIDADGAFRR